jgi:hypothetical protein
MEKPSDRQVRVSRRTILRTSIGLAASSILQPNQALRAISKVPSIEDRYSSAPDGLVPFDDGGQKEFDIAEDIVGRAGCTYKSLLDNWLQHKKARAHLDAYKEICLTEEVQCLEPDVHVIGSIPLSDMGQAFIDALDDDEVNAFLRERIKDPRVFSPSGNLMLDCLSDDVVQQVSDLLRDQSSFLFCSFQFHFDENMDFSFDWFTSHQPNVSSHATHNDLKLLGGNAVLEAIQGPSRILAGQIQAIINLCLKEIIPPKGACSSNNHSPDDTNLPDDQTTGGGGE